MRIADPAFESSEGVGQRFRIIRKTDSSDLKVLGMTNHCEHLIGTSKLVPFPVVLPYVMPTLADSCPTCPVFTVALTFPVAYPLHILAHGVTFGCIGPSLRSG
jgi:hypothetical protein